MNKIKNLSAVCLLIVSLSTTNSFAQDKPQWSVSFSKNIDWYFLTSSGILLVCNNEALFGIDPQKKDTIWSLPAYKGMPVESIKRFPNSPYMEIVNFEPYLDNGKSKGGVFGMLDKVSGKREDKGRLIILDPVQGIALFDNKLLEIRRVEKKNYLPAINSFFIQGQQEGKSTGVIGVYDLTLQKLLWVKEKPVKLALFSLRDDELLPKLDPGGNIIFRFVDNTYRYNRQTGELLWQRLQDSLYQIVFNKDKGFFYGSGGVHVSKLDLSIGKTVMEVQPSGYKILQVKGLLFKKAFGDGISLLPRENDLLAAFDYSFNLFDYASLQPKWIENPSFDPYKVKNVIVQPDGKYIVSLRHIAAAVNAITLIDSSGKILWKEPYVIKGNITKYVEYTPNGLVYVTNEIADIVDWTTGKSRLREPLSFEKTDFIMVTQSKEKKTFAFYTNGQLFELNYETGKISTLLKKTGFKGDDADKIPNLLEARADGYFLAAPQNIVLVGYDGIIKYQKYYDRPGMSDKMRGLLSRVGGLAVGYLFNDQAQQVTNIMYNTGMMDIQNYAMVVGFDNVYGGTGSAVIMSGLSNQVFARARTHEQFLQGSKNYRLMLAKLETGGNGFIKVDKDSGKELQSIRLDDKEPTIKIDDAIAGMYYLSKDYKTISFYSLAE